MIYAICVLLALVQTGHLLAIHAASPNPQLAVMSAVTGATWATLLCTLICAYVNRKEDPDDTHP